MPCQCDGYENVSESLRRDVDQATRAACDMRTILRKFGLEHELCLETIEWIRRHDKADAARIEYERKNKVREQTKQRALDKLTMDERRVLGL
jgi:hypothetical protein